MTKRGRAVLGVAILCALALTAGWWMRARCVPDGWGTASIYAGWCYTDVYPLWFAEALDVGARPYLDHPVEYPVLTGAQMWGAAVVARALPGDPAVSFFHLTVAAGGAVLLGVVGLLARFGVPPRRLLWIAAAPTLVTTSALNWDAVPVALTIVAVLAHVNGRDGWSGIAAGLGAAAKVFPALLVPLVILARLAQGRPRDAVVHGAAAAGTWLAVNVPVALLAPEGWWRFYGFSRERPPDWDSLWFVGQAITGVELPIAVVNGLSALLFIGAATAVVRSGVRGPLAGQPERWWTLLPPLLAVFLLTNKVYSPQFSLWLLPLLPLALPRVGPFVAFTVADLAVFATRFPFLNGQAGFEEVLGYGWLGAAVVVRAATLVWVVLACLRPSPQALGPVPGSMRASRSRS